MRQEKEIYDTLLEKNDLKGFYNRLDKLFLDKDLRDRVTYHVSGLPDEDSIIKLMRNPELSDHSTVIRHTFFKALDSELKDYLYGPHSALPDREILNKIAYYTVVHNKKDELRHMLLIGANNYGRLIKTAEKKNFTHLKEVVEEHVANLTIP